jgi:Ca2+-transporting ATPase
MTDQIHGLSSVEAKKRLAEFGLNQMAKPFQVKFWRIAKEEITEPMILLLLAVVFFYFLWGKLEDALTILVIILILVFVEIWNEYRAKKAISSLSRMATPKTKVWRDGQITEIKSEEVVPGDILILTPGTRIAADGKASTSFSIQADESALTGESFPVEKKIGDEVYAGTLVVFGEGKAEVLATGGRTKIGRVSELAQTIREPKTALQLSMKSLAKSLAGVALFFSLAIPFLGFLRGQDFRQMVLTGLSLAFATIPEELPIVVTMVLGLGAYRLSQRKVLIKRIKAAENLGNATIILTDKTGTITENKMQVVSVFPTNQEPDVLKAALLVLTEISLFPSDRAILARAEELKIKRTTTCVLRERSFGDGRKTKSVLRETAGGLNLGLIGAPEEVLSLSRGRSAEVADELERESSRGRRVIAVARKHVSSENKDLPFSELEKNLDFVGLISFEDPPREGVKETIENARKAGIRTIMVTGDHPKTAGFIARDVGIEAARVVTGEELDRMSVEQLRKVVKEASVFARTTPEQKYRLVTAGQENREIVAVTGDGVNDTLALKGADIGIAMGVRGTDAAKEAADIVLADDNFVTIGQGMFEGRKLFDNLSKGIKYYLSVKTALILVFLFPVILGIPLPFAPIQIIVLELFMDLAASVGFVVEPAEKTIYTRPPRNPRERFLNPKMVTGIALSGLSLFAAVTLSYFYALGQHLPLVQAQTFAFTAWVIGHIFLAFVSRSDKEPLFVLGFFTNKAMTLWAAAAFAFLLIIIAVPAAGTRFKVSSLTVGQIGLVLIICALTIFWQEAKKVFLYRRQ